MAGCAVALLVLTGTARAAPPVAWVVGEPGACPSPAALAAQLAPLLPRFRVVAGEPAEGDHEVRISDGGARYGVTVDGVERTENDEARRCDERARTAAVLVALALETPSFGPPPVPPALPRRKAWVELEAAGLVEAGTSAPLTGGAALRLSAGNDRIAGVLGVSGVAPGSWSFTGAESAQVTRVPIDAGLRATLRRGPVELAGDLGLSATVLKVSGTGFGATVDGRGVEWGLRAAGTFRLRAGPRLAPFVSVEALYAPAPHRLVIDPGDRTITLPYLWLGLLLGAAVRIQ